MRPLVLLLMVGLACSDGTAEHSADWLRCPPGTEHKGGRPAVDIEFCQERGSVSRHGPERQFGFHSSVVVHEGNWVHGVKEGRWIARWPSGRTLETGSYAAGKEAGIWRKWNDRGELEYERSYAGGELHGLASSYGFGLWIEYRCYDHGKELWMVRHDGVGKAPSCPGPPPAPSTAPSP